MNKDTIFYTSGGLYGSGGGGGSRGHFGGPSHDWLQDTQAVMWSTYKADESAVRYWLIAGLVVGALVLAMIVLSVYWQRSVSTEQALAICQRHMVWSTPPEGQMPVREYLPEWAERCARLQALAMRQSALAAAKHEHSDRAFVDGVLARSH